MLKATQDYQCVVLTSGTGSGKTIVVPVAIVLDSLPSRKVVACTQPRVLPAVSVAKHVAKQQDVEIGEQVGYRIRFEQRVSASTLLAYMTDGTSSVSLIQTLCSPATVASFSTKSTKGPSIPTS